MKPRLKKTYTEPQKHHDLQRSPPASQHRNPGVFRKGSASCRVKGFASKKPLSASGVIVRVLNVRLRMNCYTCALQQLHVAEKAESGTKITTVFQIKPDQFHYLNVSNCSEACLRFFIPLDFHNLCVKLNIKNVHFILLITLHFCKVEI